MRIITMQLLLQQITMGFCTKQFVRYSSLILPFCVIIFVKLILKIC